MKKEEPKAGAVLPGRLAPERIQVLLVQACGTSVKTVKMFDVGLRTEKMFDPILPEGQLESL